MANKKHFKVGGEGSKVLPITGGVDTFTATDLSINYAKSEFYVVVYSDTDCTIKADPTVGKITFKSHNYNNTGNTAGGDFSAKYANSESRSTVTSRNSMTSASIIFDGVDSGLFAKAWVIQRGEV